MLRLDVSIALRRGVRLGGKLIFDGHGVLTPPADASRVRISMAPVRAEGEYAVFGAGSRLASMTSRTSSSR